MKGLPFKLEKAYLLRVIETARANLRIAHESLPESEVQSFWWEVIEKERTELQWAMEELTKLKRELKQTFGN